MLFRQKQTTMILFRLILLCSFFVIHLSLSAQKQVAESRFQRMDGTEITFPFKDQQKPYVLVLSFGQESQKELSTWADPMVQKFIRKSGLLDAMLDAQLINLQVLSERDLMQLKLAGDRVEQEVPEELKPSLYYVKSSDNPLKTTTSGKSKVYVVVCDASGKISGFVGGSFSEGKMEKIEQWILDIP